MIVQMQQMQRLSDRETFDMVQQLGMAGRLGPDWQLSLPPHLQALYERSSGVQSNFAGGQDEVNPAQVEEGAYDYGANLFRQIGQYGELVWTEEPDPEREEGSVWRSSQAFNAYPGQFLDAPASATIGVDQDISGFRIGEWRAEPGGMAEYFRNERLKEIDQSIAAPRNYSQDQTLGWQYGQQGSSLASFMAGKNRDRPQTRFRNVRGQFDRKALTLSQAEIDTVGDVMRDILLENYDRLIGRGHGGDQTGALRDAVSKSKAEAIKNDEGGFVISMPLPDEPGIQRPGFTAERPSTGEYGKYVFLGRPGIQPGQRMLPTGVVSKGKMLFKQASSFMRFRLHGQMITTKNVKPSRTDLNIYEMNAGQRAKIAERIQAAFGPLVQNDLASAAGAE